jgi:Flp pilus assembly pilin Flp
MLNFIKTFARDEAGAVTVDWVVLTAAVVGLGVAIMGQVAGGTKKMAESISTELSTTAIKDAGTATAY